MKRKIFFTIGAISLFLIPITYYLMNIHHSARVWIINKLYPFSHLGSGPFQFMVYTLLLIFGITMVIAGLMLKPNDRWKRL